jgi:hypothetical protein
MKRVGRIAVAACLVVVSASTGLAADLPAVTPSASPPPPPLVAAAYNWAGPYFGFYLGNQRPRFGGAFHFADPLSM